jgi:cobalt-zinc-cadmium efflux system outer membrane protein
MEAVRQAVERSPAVTAARSRVEAADAAVRGARAPYNPQVEVAPGVGFTNGNALLSQRFDIAGRRSAEARVLLGDQAASMAEWERTRLQVAGEARLAYYDLARARAVETATLETTELARQLREAVRRRVEIGEAPAVQVTRAEIEVGRAEQEVIRARGDASVRLVTLNRLLGLDPTRPQVLADSVEVPAAPASTVELVEQALNRRPELNSARALVQVQQGQVDVARSQRRPDLFAEFATDVWSLDRDAFRSRNLGFQVRLSMPLFDRGRIRADVDRARAGVREREAEVEVVRRTLAVEVERAAAELATAREIALNYRQTLLPRSQELLKASRTGFEIGLTSFLEVLEAQRVLRQAQTEYLTSLTEALRAQIALERALGIAPGLEPAQPLTERK